jgi:hypothetical protein
MAGVSLLAGLRPSPRRVPRPDVGNGSRLYLAVAIAPGLIPKACSKMPGCRSMACLRRVFALLIGDRGENVGNYCSRQSSE